MDFPAGYCGTTVVSNATKNVCFSKNFLGRSYIRKLLSDRKELQPCWVGKYTLQRKQKNDKGKRNSEDIMGKVKRSFFKQRFSKR